MKNMTQEERLAKEELTKTQVLNLQELERVASYEKKVSKKPALILAILGVMCITIGASYNNVISIFGKSSNEATTNVAHKEIETTIDPVATINCQYATVDPTQGFDMAVNMTLILKNGKLSNYTKVMDVTPTIGQEILAQSTIPPLFAAYQNFESLVIPGYKILSTAKGSGFETVVAIELNQLDATQLTIYHEQNVVTKVEFALDDSKDAIIQKAKTLGYLCQ